MSKQEQWIDEEQNMLENYPEIRNPQLRKPTIKEVLRRKFGRHFGGFLCKLGAVLKWGSMAVAGLTMLSACTPPVTPDPTPKPPIVKPDPDPVKPDPDPVKPDPDPVKPDPDPVKPDPDPVKPDPEPDKLTKKQVVEKVTTAVQNNVQRVVGYNATNVNYLAVDYKEEEGKFYADILVEYHDAKAGVEFDGVKLVRVPMKVGMTEDSLKDGSFIPTGKRDGTELVSMIKAANKEQAGQALEKLQNDGQASFKEGNNFSSLTQGGGAPDSTLGCRVTFVTITRLDRDKFVSYSVSVKSDGVNPNGFIVDNLINGTLNETYRIVSKTEYEFSDNAIILFEAEGEDEKLD